MAGGDSLEQLDRTARMGAGKLGGTPRLTADEALVLLEDIAYAHVLRPGDRTILDLAAGSRRLRGTDRAEVARLLTGCGLFTAEDGGFSFADEEMAHFLAAKHLVRRHPRGPRWWHPGERLAPRPGWPWPALGTDLWLAALWWQSARARVERRLNRLLRDEHWYPNIRFVLELIRRDLVPGHDFTGRVVEVLREGLHGDRLADDEWPAAAGWLGSFDPATARLVLDDLVRASRNGCRPQRRLLAVDELAQHDPVRAQENLAFLAANLIGKPPDRLATARLIRDRDPALGVRALLLLTQSPTMGERRVPAAIEAGSADVMRDLTDPRHGVSDPGRLKLLAGLLARNDGMARETAQRIAATAKEAETPARAAVLLHPHDPAAAWEVLEAVAWSGEAGDAARLHAVKAIGELDRGQAIPALQRLSRDPTAGGDIRVDAAQHIVDEHGGPVTALVDLAGDGHVPEKARIRAAEFVGRTQPRTAARLLVAIAPRRLEILEQAYDLDRSIGAAALANLAADSRVPGRRRLAAVEAAGARLDRSARIRLYSRISETADNEPAMEAAQKLLALDSTRGHERMADLAARTTAGFPYRVEAALAGGAAAVPVLRELATSGSVPDALRLKAAKALDRYDRKAADAPLRDLAARGHPHDVRLQAALAVRGKHSVRALVSMSDDRSVSGELRLQAAMRAREKDPAAGLAALRKLGQDPRLPGSVRDKVQGHLR